MLSSTFSTKRILSLTLAGVLGFAVISAVAGPSQAVTIPKVVSSPLTGPANVAGTVTITGTGFKTGSVKNVVTVAFETGACTVAVGTLTGSEMAITSATKLVVKTPSASFPAGVYTVCLYDGSTPANLIGAGAYTAYVPPAVLTVSPIAGTVSGGAAITITGTGFTAKSTATFGGTALTSVKVTGSTVMTGIAPSHAAGDANVVVHSEGGASPLAGPPIVYTYANAIVLTGDTTGSGVNPTTIDISGLGFDSLDFVGSNATVSLVAGAWSPGNPGTACTNINEVSDKEIVCEVPGGGALPDGAYTVTVVNTASPEAFQTVVSSSATYTVANF